jgi:hypothetical protein
VCITVGKICLVSHKRENIAVAAGSVPIIEENEGNKRL